MVGFELVAPAAALANEFPAAGHSLRIGNYRPRAGSPVAAAGLGALGPDGPNPPPPPPPPPPDAVDWAALVALAAAVGEQVAVVNLAAEAATDALGELLVKLAEYEAA